MTNSKRVMHPLTLDEAFQKIIFYQTSFTLIAPLSETFFTFNRSISKYPIYKERIFDLYLVATAIDNGVQHICTWNVKDLRKIKEIKVETPQDILSSITK